MSKSIKKPKAFQIPTVDEVEKFINEAKPGWPAAYCSRVAQKFVLRYQTTGWQYGGRLMKDWHAAFWLNWAEPKYPEDVKALEDALKSWQHKCLMDEKRRKSAGLFAVVEGNGPSPQDRFLESLDEVFAAFKVGNATDSQLRNVGDWLRRTNLNGVTTAQMDQIVIEQGNLMDHGKILQARQFFGNLLKKSWTVKQYYYSRLPQGEQSKTA
jgi:hypothetical protein